MDESDEEVLREFLVEATESLDKLDAELLELERAPSRELLASIFRRMHTIKGTCGFLNLNKLGALTHAGESLLSKLRDGVLPVTTATTNALLKTGDALRSMLVLVEKTGSDGDEDHGALVAELSRLASSSPAPAPEAPQPAAAASEASAPRRPSAPRAKRARAKASPRPDQQVLVGAIESMPNPESTPTPEPMVPSTAVDPPKQPLAATAAPDDGETRGPSVADQSVRVDVAVLDRLMNLIGELVLARNQILQLLPTQEDPAFQAASQRLNLITSELQADVMKTRMQPISTVWGRFGRLVRDVAASCGKEARVELEGGETELDRTILDALRDPLTHIVRNAIDHGIERPEVRVERGKPRHGTLRIRSYHEGGKVNIDISDDGGGIDLERVRRRAVDRGIVTSEQAKRLSDREATGLIFLPGFSTAETVTSLSGRGVGMDVVKTNIELVGGTFEVLTHLGAGTSVRIKIPLTLAIIPALIVWAGARRYAIPQVSLLELVRIEPENTSRAIEQIFGAPVYRLRGRLLPILSLDKELGLVPATRTADCALNIIVLQADSQQFGLLVDDISDTQEIVVKPLSRRLKRIDVFAGATILGDGTVSLILDVVGLAQRARVVSAAQDKRLAMGEQDVANAATDHGGLLLVGVGAQTRYALPLADVARLEEFGRESLELVAGRFVVQYRGHVMPVVVLSDALGQGQPVSSDDERINVIVHRDGDRTVGLLVDRVLDIVDEMHEIDRMGRRTGVLGTVVVQGRVTELLDVGALVRASASCLWEAA